MLGTKNQDTLLSWWPLPHTWHGSGFNIGYWTEECETWFRKRLTDIEQGTAKPLSSKKWKKDLKRSRRRLVRFGRMLEVDPRVPTIVDDEDDDN